MASEPRRVAERVTLPEPLVGTIGDTAAKVVQVSISGCRVEHAPRLPIGGSTRLKFAWNGKQVAISGKVVWSELRFAAGEKFHVSGVQFAESDGEGLQLVRTQLAAFLEMKLAGILPARENPAPFLEPAPFLAFGDEIEIDIPAASSAHGVPDKAGVFIECRLQNGAWARREIDEPLQPRDGFALPAPASEREIDGYCRAYEAAGDEVRGMIRASLELRTATNAG